MEITVKNGDNGISWVIKRQLKEDGVNVKNINSCWTQIMKSFEGDNESKVQNGDTIGEKWTSLNANVKIAVNDTIKIADTTWKKIKEIVSKAAGSKNKSSKQAVQTKVEGAKIVREYKRGHVEEYTNADGNIVELLVGAKKNNKIHAIEYDKNGKFQNHTDYDEDEKPKNMYIYNYGASVTHINIKDNTKQTWEVVKDLDTKEGKCVVKSDDGKYYICYYYNDTPDLWTECDKEGNPIV